MAGVAESFEALLFPVAPAEFHSRFWEQTFLHLERGRAEVYDSLFSLADIDRWLLSNRELDSADLVLLVPPAGSEQPTQRFRGGELPVEVAYEAVANRSSLVLNRLESSWQPLSKLVETLGQAFCARIGVNAYLTPAAAQTFPIHIDNHDVFILQLSGEKLWHLHRPMELPVYHLDYKEDLKAPSFWKNPAGAPLEAEVTLRPGDLLYVPRGMPHCAIARDSTSLHLTVSVNPLTWIDFLKAAVEESCFDVPLLRRALPPGFVSDPGLQATMREDFASILRSFNGRVSFDETLGILQRRRIRLQGYPQDGHFAQLGRLEEITPDSRVERRPGLLCLVETETSEPFCRIRFGAAYVRAPLRLQPALELVRDHPGGFLVGDLPGLDGKGQVVLARRLLRAGLLRLQDAPVAAAAARAG